LSLLGHGNELRRRQQAALGVTPAQQCLEPADLLVDDADEGLVMHLELAARERIAHRELFRPLLLEMMVHARVVEAEGIAAAFLGAVERDIGVAQHAV
jgi:hypothetical protein